MNCRLFIEALCCSKVNSRCSFSCSHFYILQSSCEIFSSVPILLKCLSLLLARFVLRLECDSREPFCTHKNRMYPSPSCQPQSTVSAGSHRFHCPDPYLLPFLISLFKNMWFSRWQCCNDITGFISTKSSFCSARFHEHACSTSLNILNSTEAYSLLLQFAGKEYNNFKITLQK